MTALSRISGFAREILVAKYLGTSALSEAFFVALKFPNFFRRLFAEGAFNAAFVPLFSSVLETEGKQKADELGRNILGLMVIALSIFTLIFLIFMPAMMFILAPGFTDKPEINEIAAELTRITFPYLLLISVATLYGGAMSTLNKFAAGAFMPVYFNLVLIFFITVISNIFETYAHALAWGVLASGVVQLIWMAYFMCKNGFSILPKYKNYFADEKIKTFLRKFAPGAMGAGIFQINLMVDVMIASFFTGAIAFLNYADRINQLPLSLIGTAMGTALLPELSRRLVAGDHSSANKGFNRALEMVMLLSMPAAFALCAIPHTIIGTLFERGEFTSADTHASALALIGFSIGLPAFTINKVFSSSFFALKDTKTPVYGATIALFLNIFLNLVFAFSFPKLGLMPHVGIALATSIAGWVNLYYLYIKLKKKDAHLRLDAHMKMTTIKITALSGLVAFIATVLAEILGYGFTRVALIVMVVFVVYFGLAIKMKIISTEEMKGFFRRRKAV